MRKILAILPLLFIGCGSPSTPVLSQITPATLTAPTLYSDPNTTEFVLTGERFATGATIQVGSSHLEADSITPTTIVVYVAPLILNPAFPENLSNQNVVPVRVINPNGQVSNTMEITVVPHCNPCGT